MGTSRDDEKASASTPDNQGNTAATYHLSRFKLFSFSVIVCVLFFLILEGLLWALDIPKGERNHDPFLGFSSQKRLFIQLHTNNGDKTAPLMVTSPDKYFFFQPQSFPLKKPANVRRVFCVGGSTTYGRPYEHKTSFCGWLEDFLAYTDPQYKWEVINAGGISYASYRVVLILEELVKYDPDLIISYIGQNEFLERRTYSRILGLPKIVRYLGSAASNLRIYALMSKMVEQLKPGEKKQKAANRYQLSKEVNTILDQAIGPKDYVRDDEQRKNIIDHFEFNLGNIVQLTRSANAKLIMVAPASKLRNESPFKSQHGSDLKGSKLSAWTQHYTAAQKLFREKRFLAALKEVSSAEELDPRYAHTYALKGDILYNLGRYTEARLSYVKARDEDICPLRAITPLHDLVIATAHELNVPVVDFAAIISNRSPNGIPDDAFFIDHVHPTIEGNKILALELLNKIIKLGMIHSPKPMTAQSLKMISSAKMAELNLIDHSNALSNLAMLANWGGKYREGRTLALRAISLNPDDPEAYYQAGLGTMGIGEDIEEALVYLHKSIALDNEAYYVYATIGESYAKLGRYAEARENFQHAIEKGDEWAQSSAHYGLGKMLEKENQLHAAIVQYKKTIEVDPQFYNAQNRIDELLRSHPELAHNNTDPGLTIRK